MSGSCVVMAVVRHTVVVVVRLFVCLLFCFDLSVALFYFYLPANFIGKVTVFMS